ncbi:hypothetical protein GXW78_13525 [Roseomonas terrae]|uniref:Uncharacterized protein n=1 Tax=Neoroseomonas terrae TaxID=424799 RepID=A0ABS5EI35_9PROT|nr:hypothetical protein [Neoroseomonas terrae]MBR0650691.1 hypothetical protein [Neoroseomonas terrae]
MSDTSYEPWTAGCLMTNRNNAVFLSVVEVEGVARRCIITVVGESGCEWGRDPVTTILLPGIDLNAVMAAVQNPTGKHTTFSSSGNRYSRIARLVQLGYERATGNTISSGVRFRWTSNDLIRYAQRWVERAPDTAGVHVGRNVEESIRFRFAMPGVDEVFYEFVSDDRVVVMTGVQAKAERERLRAAEMEGKMVNF